MTKDVSPAFQFYPRDFLSSEGVRVMTAAGRGAYILLLCACWLEGSLPADDTQLRKLSDTTETEWEACRDVVRARFSERNGRLYNARLDKERAKQRDFSRIQSDKGRKSVESRRNRGSTTVQPGFNRGSTERVPEVNSASAFASASSEEIHKSGVAPWDEGVEPDPPPDPVVENARWLVESYPAWYSEERHGARCHNGNLQRTFDAAREIVRTWPEREHVEAMARVYLRSEVLNKDLKHASRGLITFGWVASGIDAQLRGAS